MKVLIVNVTLDPVAGGGTATKTLDLASALARAGVRTTVLATDVGIRGAPVPSSAASIVTFRCLSRRFYVPLLRHRQLARLVQGADLALLVNHWTLLNAATYHALRRAGKPYVVLPAGALAPFGRSRSIKRLFDAVVGSRLIQGASGHIATTREEVATFARYGVRAEDVTVIPNAIDAREDWREAGTEFRERLRGAPFVLFVGRLNPIKGPDLLLEAFGRVASRFDRHHLVLAGPNEGLGTELRGRAEALGIADRTHVVGPLLGRDKVQAFAGADLLAVPSRQEAMSIVALEAGLAARPVLVTDACGIPDVEEVDGGVSAPASVDGLEAGLVRLLSSPDALTARGERWQRCVRERYGWDVVVRRYVELFERILKPVGGITEDGNASATASSNHSSRN